MQKTKHWLMTAVVLQCSLATKAYDFTVGGICYNITSSTGLTVEVTYQGNDIVSEYKYTGEITIPSTVTYNGKTYSVTSIGFGACFECWDLTSITLPESVTSIENNAFCNCLSLNSINIPKRVTSIEYNAFFGCQSLTSITLPESLTSIDVSAFAYCSNLTSITIPRGVESIGDSAFSGCGFTSVILPEGLTSIGSYAFAFCDNLTSITIPKSVTNIGGFAFAANGSSLTAVHISSIESWCEISFNDAYSNPLCNAHNLYLNGELVTDLTIPEGVTSIGSHAFQDCTSLTSITLPESMTSIGTWAFRDCCNLLDVYCNAESVPNTTADAFNGSYPEYVTLHVPANAMASYKASAPWSNFGEIVSLTNELITGITLNQNAVTLVEGEQLQLIATITPNYATDPSVTWSSSDENVAIVDANGVVTAIASGTAIITATANDGSNVSASSEVTVERLTHVSLTVSQYGSGTYSSEYALDFSEVKGLKAYAASAYNSQTGVVTLLRLKTTKPGEGIFVKGEPGTYKIPIIEESADNTLNMLVGTLTETIVNTLSNDGLYTNYKYTIKEGDTEPMFYQFADGSTQDAGRAYLKIPTAWLTSSEAKSIGYRFDDGETTDIEDNSNLEIRNSELEFYDLMGRRVENPVKNGIYIVNGEKIVY